MTNTPATPRVGQHLWVFQKRKHGFINTPVVVVKLLAHGRMRVESLMDHTVVFVIPQEDWARDLTDEEQKRFEKFRKTKAGAERLKEEEAAAAAAIDKLAELPQQEILPFGGVVP